MHLFKYKNHGIKFFFFLDCIKPKQNFDIKNIVMFKENDKSLIQEMNRFKLWRLSVTHLFNILVNMVNNGSMYSR